MRPIVVSVAMASAAVVIVGCGSASTRSSLERAASVDHPGRFVFVDRPDAASLMECLGAAETLVVTVDADQNVMAVRRDGESNPVVIWTGDASFVDSKLLTTGVGWIRVGRDLAEPTRADVEAAVGSSLAGYVFAERIVPNPVAVATSALAVAGDIDESESPAGEVTVSVEVDGSLGAIDGLEVGSIPDLRFRIVDGRIVAIAAHLPSGGEDSFGFVWEYDQTTEVQAIVVPPTATEIRDIAGMVGTGDRGPPECVLGS